MVLKSSGKVVRSIELPSTVAMSLCGVTPPVLVGLFTSSPLRLFSGIVGVGVPMDKYCSSTSL